MWAPSTCASCFDVRICGCAAVPSETSTIGAAGNQASCHSLRDGFLRVAARLFEPILDLWQVLKLCRFAVLTIGLAVYVLIFNPQGQEVLIRLQADNSLFPHLAFLMAVILWGLVTWYSCRVILSFRFPDWPPPDAPVERAAWIHELHHGVPRALGIAVFVTVAAALLKAMQQTESWGTGIALSILSLLCAGLFTYFVIYRHTMAAKLRRRSPRAARLLADGPLHERPSLRAYKELPGVTKAGIWTWVIGLFVIPFLAFQFRELSLWFAPRLTSATVLLLAAASWVPIGTILVYGSGHYRIPVFTILFFVVLGFSFLNDNHRIRTTPTTGDGHGSRLQLYFRKWLDDRSLRHPDPQAPVILVAAEGGGIRAAYWTASILTRIQRDRPDFAPNTFAISSVSGGSLGAGTFAALLADRDGGGPCASSERFLECAQSLLSRDFLAPTFATMLYPELVQRFLFLPVPAWDRARTMEESWERAWTAVTGSHRFARPFDDLWNGPAPAEVPNLIFNMASVEWGNRVVLSSLPIGDPVGDGHCLDAFTGRANGPFDDVIDLRAVINAHLCSGSGSTMTVPLSSAINNSARFSFVSPAGTVNSRLHLVDGGYFENSGTVTLEEVYHGIQPVLAEHNRQIVVLYISNDPDSSLPIRVRYRGPLRDVVEEAADRCLLMDVQGQLPWYWRNDTPGCPTVVRDAPNTIVLAADPSFRRLLHQHAFYTMHVDKHNRVVGLAEPDALPLDEVTTPLFTIFRARFARASHAYQHLQRQTGSTRFFQLGLRKATANLPLGWTLSAEATNEMNRQLDAWFSEQCPRDGPLIQYFEQCWPEQIGKS